MQGSTYYWIIFAEYRVHFQGVIIYLCLIGLALSAMLITTIR